MWKFVSWVLILLPPTLGFLYVRLFGVNVAYGDQWRIAHLFGKLSSGTLTLGLLWNQLNEHRIFVPRVVMLWLGSLTRWNNVAEMYVTQSLLLLTLLVLLAVFGAGVESSWKLLVFVPVSLLVFSLRQAETMLMGLLMQFALVLVFAVLAFYFLDGLWRNTSGKQLTFPAALVSATLASLSSVHGLLVWPVGLVQLLVGPLGKRAKWLLGATWGLIGVSEWVVYFLDYHMPLRAAANPDGSTGFGPLYFMRFVVTLMGASLSWWQGPAFAAGLLLFTLVVATLFLVVRDGKLAEHSFWVTLLVFTFLILLSIAVGRADHGIEQALVSRYTTYSILGVVALYALLAKLLLERRSRLTAALFIVLLAIMLLSQPVAYAGGVKAGISTEATRQRAAFVLATYESQPDVLLATLYPDPEVVRKRAPILEKLGYNIFSERQSSKLRGSVELLGTVPSSDHLRTQIAHRGSLRSGKATAYMPSSTPVDLRTTSERVRERLGD